MIAKTFFLTKTFHRIALKSLREKISLRDHDSREAVKGDRALMPMATLPKRAAGGEYPRQPLPG
jgi:hypothetical protein